MESSGNCNSFWQVHKTFLALQQCKGSIRQRNLHEAAPSLPASPAMFIPTALRNSVKVDAPDSDPDMRNRCGLF